MVVYVTELNVLYYKCMFRCLLSFILSCVCHFIWLDCADFCKMKKKSRKRSKRQNKWRGIHRKLYESLKMRQREEKKKKTRRKKHALGKKRIFEDANVLVFETTLMLMMALQNDHDYDRAKSELRNDGQTDS